MTSTARLGPLIEYAFDIKPIASGEVSDKFLVSSGQSLDGYRVGLFVELERPRGLWRSELAYFKGTSFLNFVNLKPSEDLAMFGHADYELSSGYSHRNLELALLRGVKVYERFSLIGGLTGGLQFKEDLGGIPDPSRPMVGAMYSLSQNYNLFILFANIGVNYHFGPLGAYVNWKPSLTSVSEGIDYEGTPYSVNYKLQIWSLGVNYFPLYRDK